MHRIYDLYYSPDQEHRLLTLLREMEICSTLPMERKGISQDSGIAIIRVTGHFEGSHEGFQRMEAKLTEAGFQFVSDQNKPNVSPRPDRRQCRQIVKAFKTHVKEQEHLRELETRTLPERIISQQEFLDVATWSLDRETLSELAALPSDRKQYSALDALIGLVTAMSVRYGLNPSDIRKVSQFLKTFSVDELNAELIAGKTFLFVPTNQRPRLLVLSGHVRRFGAVSGVQQEET
jgi:hypothetical protein